MATVAAPSSIRSATSGPSQRTRKTFRQRRSGNAPPPCLGRSDDLPARRQQHLGCARGSSRQHFADDFAVDVSQPEITALKAEGEFGVFQAEQVQDRGMNVMHVTPVFDWAETQFVRLPKNTPGLHAAAGKPHG